MSDSPNETHVTYPLHRHELTHLPHLEADEEIFATRFAASCSMMNCSGKCCRGGVYVDLEHRDRVLREAALVIQHMEPAQEHDPSLWFETEEIDDADFPSGKCVGTQVVGKGCVFLDSQRRCVLHMAESTSPGLKPFYCRAFPVVVSDAVLTLDTEWCPEETQCCGPDPNGTQPALDLLAFEIEHVVGKAALHELRDIARARRESEASE
jgi:Fe-S-cluster containining protein